MVPSMLATLSDRPAGRRHAIQVGVARLVVRLGHARGYEVDLRTVRRPFHFSLVVLAVGDLLRLRFVAAFVAATVKMCVWRPAST